MNKNLAVILCWNNKDIISDAVDSLLRQSTVVDVLVIDNGSSDGSPEYLEKKYNEEFILIKNEINKGFSGGANIGFDYAVKNGYDFVALLNSDAIANEEWVYELSLTLQKNKDAAISTSKIIKMNGKEFDTTGEQFFPWGISSPRGRNELDKGQYDDVEEVFGGSGGASMYRVNALKEIGYFDEDFFAYYEDADLSFRAHLFGWKVIYNPKAVVKHHIGASSSKVSGLAYKMSIKNPLMVIVKNVPLKYYFGVMLRYKVLWTGNIINGIKNRYFKEVLIGTVLFLVLIPKKIAQRIKLQKVRRAKGISADDIKRLMTPGLPDLVKKQNTVRLFRKLTFRKD
ncbi:MAG: hypothetical protein QG623_184 [Patescibacteria group bacterium]|nr:hypothetical protein [Patescibacteria group bacterium]